MSEEIERKLDAIISLLARSTIGSEKIKEIVVSRKTNPGAYIKAYNQLGEKTLTDLAKEIGVSKQALSGVVGTWEKEGIVYNMGNDSSPKYTSVIKLSEDPSNKSSGQSVPAEPAQNSAVEEPTT